MYWQEILAESIFAILLIGFAVFCFYTFYILHIWLCADLIKRDEQIKRSMKLRKPVFEQDEEDSKIIHFYPDRK